MAVRMEYISRIICPESPDVTAAEQSGLQVYMPAYSLKLMFTAEKCHLLSRLSKSWLNLAAMMNIHLNLTLAFHPCHFSK